MDKSVCMRCFIKIVSLTGLFVGCFAYIFPLYLFSLVACGGGNNKGGNDKQNTPQTDNDGNTPDDSTGGADLSSLNVGSLSGWGVFCLSLPPLLLPPPQATSENTMASAKSSAHTFFIFIQNFLLINNSPFFI